VILVARGTKLLRVLSGGQDSLQRSDLYHAGGASHQGGFSRGRRTVPRHGTIASTIAHLGHPAAILALSTYAAAHPAGGDGIASE